MMLLGMHICFLQQASSSRPPAVHYIIRYHEDDFESDEEVDDDNVTTTYTLISVVPGRWVVEVIAVNVLGPNHYKHWPSDSTREFKSEMA